MSEEQIVYATCPDCRKQVMTVRSPGGLRTLVKHNGRGQRRQCPGSYRAITGLPETVAMPTAAEAVFIAADRLTLDEAFMCALGCGGRVKHPDTVCPVCHQWRVAVQDRIDGGCCGG